MLENRELAAHEQAMEILNNLAASFNIVTISRIKRIISEELLRQALNITQSRHPLLNARIVAKSNSFWFEDKADKIPLSVVKKQQIHQWEEVVVEELNQKISSDKNLLRVTLINFEEEENICYLITTIHHAIADALSCIQLHSEILTNCQKITEGEVETNITQLAQLPSIYKLIPKSLQGFTGEIGNVLYLSRLKLQLIRSKPASLNFEKNVALESRSCGMVHRKLDSELTACLVDVCRQQKTTVQAALGAAMLFALAKKTNTQRKNNYFSFRSAVNVRPRLQPQVNNEHLGAIVSCILSFHNLKENNNFWDLARDIKQKLEKRLATSDVFRFLTVSKMLLQSLLNNPEQSPGSAHLTNAGRLTIPQNYGQFELEEISFVAAQAAFGGIFAAAVSTFRGQMFLNFIFSQPSISTETVKTLASDMICVISEVCNQN
ncbi:phthiocerol/phthiodiolone dimycocerosyl transferase family protein [Calothrix sp. CCY 0018]|uniref:phthiocerol/phthiodiolone dimycocerosyl transferase family protein n=1 Tax=Calothrix sp. CCY 0018 TaxID=3103864 RepID=UPI0039C71F69